MRLLSKKIVWLLIVAHLTVGLTAYGFSAADYSGHWLAHELDHGGMIPPALEHLHDSLNLSDSEHSLLHATSSFHPFFVISLFNGLEELILSKVKFLPAITDLYQTVSEPPYRPPQLLFLV